MATERELNKIRSQIIRYLMYSKPYLFKLEEIVQETGNGIISVQLRVYKGFVTDVIETKVQKRETFRFDKQDIEYSTIYTDGKKETPQANKGR